MKHVCGGTRCVSPIVLVISETRQWLVDFIESPGIDWRQPATLPVGESGSQARRGPSPSLGLRPSHREGGVWISQPQRGLKRQAIDHFRYRVMA